MANEFFSVLPKRNVKGGTGYIAGIAPGVVTVGGLPAQRPLELRLRDGHRSLVERIYSAVDGTYLFTDLDPYQKYDIIARDEPDYVYNDLIVGGIWPWTDDEIILHGPAIPKNLKYPFNHTYEITGGVSPYSISTSSVIPSGVSATIADKILTLSSTGDQGQAVNLIIEDSSTLSKTIDIRPLPVEPYYVNFASLIHFDGSGALDMSGKTWTLSGNAHITSTNKVFGNGSLALDGTGDYASTPHHSDFNIENKDFTIELWVYRQSGVALHYLVSKRPSGTGQSGWEWRINATDLMQFFYTGGSSFLSNSTIPVGEWVHLAVARRDTTVMMFINGVLDNSAIFSNGTLNTTDTVKIGIGSDLSGNLNGYIDEFRFVSGEAIYVSNFAVPTHPYPCGRTISLLHFDGVEASTNFPDSKGRVWVTSADSKVDTKIAKFDGSIALDGTADCLTSPDGEDFYLGSEDFTMEAQVYAPYWPSPNLYPTIISQRDSNTSQHAFTWYFAGGSKGKMYFAGNNSGFSFNTNEILSPGAWHHVAVTREDDKIRMFYDGVKVLEETFTASIINSTERLLIGSFDNPTYPDSYWFGNIDELRITKGVARYINDFNPPEFAFPDQVWLHSEIDPYWSKVSSLLHFDTGFDDEKGPAWSATGNTSVANSEIVFDGTGNINTPDRGGFNFGSGDFTIEMMVKPSSLSGFQNLIRKSLNTDYAPFTMAIDGDKLRSRCSSDGINWNMDRTSTEVLIANQWNHVALVRSGSVFTQYVNGIASGTTSFAPALMTNTAGVYIGTHSDNTSPFTGYMDEIRITKGVARYIANFTPPTEPFPNI